MTLLGQQTGSGFNSPAEVVREVIEVGHDVLAHDPSPFVWRHRIEFFGGDQPRCVGHVTRVPVAMAEGAAVPVRRRTFDGPGNVVRPGATHEARRAIGRRAALA
ncbi:MAG: hypothetical protein ACRDRT_14235 [Pseudonocardiaceae bacterium]